MIREALPGLVPHTEGSGWGRVQPGTLCSAEARRAGSGSWVRLLCRGGDRAWCLQDLAQNGTQCLMGKLRRAPTSPVKRELFPKAAPGLRQELEGLMVTLEALPRL